MLLARFFAGVAIGALFTGVGAVTAIATADGGGAVTTTITTTTVAPDGDGEPTEAPWTDEPGVRFESVVVVPEELEVDGTRAILQYDLVGLAQRPFAFGAPFPTAAPELWELRTVAGDAIAADVGLPGNPDPFSGSDEIPTQRVTFDVPEGFALDDIASIVVTGWRRALPVEQIIEIQVERGITVELIDGNMLTLDTVLEQSSGTIIGFDFDRPSDEWYWNVDRAFIRSNQYRAVGPQWISVALTAEGSGVQFTSTLTSAPQTMEIAFSTVLWVPVEPPTAVEIPLGGAG